MNDSRFLKIIIIESVLSLILLFSAHFFKGALKIVSLISFVWVFIICVRLIPKPVYAVLNLCFIVTSGVFGYFFYKELGIKTNFVFYFLTIISSFKFLLPQNPSTRIIYMYFGYILFNALYYQVIHNVVIIGSKNDESSALALLFPVIMFAFIKGGIKTLSHLKDLYFILICAIIISSIDFWLTYFIGPLNPVDDVISLDSIYQKVSGISHQVNSLAHYISYLMPILIFGLFYSILLLSRQQLIYCLIFFAITLIWLSSRSGILLTIIFFGIILFLYKGVKIRYKIALVLCFASGIIFAINQNLPIVERFVLGEESGDAERFDKFAQTFFLFLESPIFGSGFGTFIFLNYKISGSTLNTHNTLLSVLVEQGIVGLLFFLTLFLTPIFDFRKYKTFYSNYMLRFNRMVITSLFLVFLGFFFDHHHGDVFYYILIAAATNSVLIFTDLKMAHNKYV